MLDAARRHAVVVFDTLNLFQWVDLPLADAQGQMRGASAATRCSVEPSAENNRADFLAPTRLRSGDAEVAAIFDQP
jgi:hypothetical protein